MLLRVLLGVFLCSFIVDAAFLSADNCTQFGSCNACTGNESCGWCDSIGQPSCLAGNSSGPGFGQTCTNALWKYSSCSQDDLCSIQSNCKQCASQAGCGWCDTRCVAGNSSTPTNQDIPCFQYASSKNSCESIDCIDYSSCSVCAQQETCGWCSDTVFGQQTCLPGSKDNINSDCTEENWFTGSRACTIIPPCSTHTNCTTCISDPNEACGWCNSRNSCIPRTESGLCSDFQLNTCDDQCTNYGDCAACVEVDHCGWCDQGSLADSLCTYGTINGPSILNGTQCNWSYETCSECSYSDCQSCNEAIECDWCFVNMSGHLHKGCFASDNLPTNHTCPAQCFVSLSPSISSTISFSSTASISVSPPRSRIVLPSRSISGSTSASISKSEKRSRSSTESPSITEPISDSPSISITISESSSGSGSGTNTTSISFTRSSSLTPSNSITLSMSASNTTSNSSSVSMSASNTTSESISRTGSVSTSDSQSSSQTKSSRASRSFSKSKSSRPSQSNSRTVSTSSSSAPSSIPSSSHSISSSHSSSTSQSPKRSPVVLSKSHTISLSPRASSLSNSSVATPWPLISLISIVTVVLIIVIVCIGLWLFYRFYWLKRWYFERLE